jgi:hypothetical protein
MEGREMKLFIDNKENDNILVDVLFIHEWMGYDWFVHRHPECEDDDILVLSEKSSGFRAFKVAYAEPEDVLKMFKKMMYNKYKTDNKIKSIIDKVVKDAVEKYGEVNP